MHLNIFYHFADLFDIVSENSIFTSSCEPRYIKFNVYNWTVLVLPNYNNSVLIIYGLTASKRLHNCWWAFIDFNKVLSRAVLS